MGTLNTPRIVDSEALLRCLLAASFAAGDRYYAKDGAVLPGMLEVLARLADGGQVIFDPAHHGED